MVNNGDHRQEPFQEPFQVGAMPLDVATLVSVARSYQPVADLDPRVADAVAASAQWVEEVVTAIEKRESEGHPEDVRALYSINTGFGAAAGRSAFHSAHLTKILSYNLVTSHAAGTGEFFDEETVRAALLIRAQALAQGYSGVRPIIIQKHLDMLNHRVYPAVPMKGSLGASGDLAPLAHMALAIAKPPPGWHGDDLARDSTGASSPANPQYQSGEAFVPTAPGSRRHEGAALHLTTNRLTGEQTLWRRVSGTVALAPIGGQIELRAKEGLALNNGATFSAAVAALTLYDAHRLLDHAEIALAMSLEAMRGFRDPFFPRVHAVRGHQGAGETARRVLRYVAGSTLLDPGDEDVDPVRIPPQDPYSLRCAPQVIGAVRDTLKFVDGFIETELNAATDNPLIFLDLPRSYKTVSCGNFHGEPIALGMDFLGIAITELGSIAERRIFKLTDYHFPTSVQEIEYGLQDFLIAEDAETRGLNSGLMIAQYTAASLVSDCKTLAHPDSVDSIPSSANKEDHVSMSLNAARHAREIVDNIEAVIAIELLCAAQALDLRREQNRAAGTPWRLGNGSAAAFAMIRDAVPYRAIDRAVYPDIRAMIHLLRSGDILRAVRDAVPDGPMSGE